MRKSRKDGRGEASLGRALVVEDDAILATALELALEDGGAEEVRVCSSIAEAMTALEDMRPDVIVLDVLLADRGDGWAIAELATTLSPKPPRIVFSTGQPDRIPENVLEMGTVLAKPYSPEALVELLAEQQKKSGLLGRLRGALE